MPEAKILVPFFGGPDDREAVELALSTGLLTCVVSFKSDKFDDNDEALIKNVINLSKQDSSVIYSTRVFNNTTDDPATAVRQECENKVVFSLIVLGRMSFPESQNPTDVERVLGNVAGSLLLHNLALDLLVVSRGQDSAKFLNLERDESGSRDG